MTGLTGEVPAAFLAARTAETGLAVLDNFDDNLSGPGDQRAVCDPALAAALAGWTGKLLITCQAPFTLPAARAGRPEQLDEQLTVNPGGYTVTVVLNISL